MYHSKTKYILIFKLCILIIFCSINIHATKCDDVFGPERVDSSVLCSMSDAFTRGGPKLPIPRPELYILYRTDLPDALPALSERAFKGYELQHFVYRTNNGTTGFQSDALGKQILRTVAEDNWMWNSRKQVAQKITPGDELKTVLQDSDPFIITIKNPNKKIQDLPKSQIRPTDDKFINFLLENSDSVSVWTFDSTYRFNVIIISKKSADIESKLSTLCRTLDVEFKEVSDEREFPEW